LQDLLYGVLYDMKQYKTLTTDQLYIIDLTEDDILKSFQEVINNTVPEEIRKEGRFAMWSPSVRKENDRTHILTLRWSKSTCDKINNG